MRPPPRLAPAAPPLAHRLHPTRRRARQCPGRPFTALGVSLLMALAACGGSSSGDGAAPGGSAPATASPAPPPTVAAGPASAPAPAPPPASAPAPAPAPASAPAPAPTAAPLATNARCADAAVLAQAVAEINRVRAAGATCGSQRYGPAGPLAGHTRLTQAALAHSTDMAQRQFFSHTGSDGSSIGTRLTAAGYAWSRAAENIAAGYGTVGAVVQGWVLSPGHCANLMDAALSDAGLACVPGPAGSAYSSYWTLTLGRPR